MPIDINNSVLYIDYLQKVKNEVKPYCFFFTPVLKHLHNLTQKRNVLHINGTGMLKKNKDCSRFGLQDWPFTVTNKYHTRKT